MYAPPATDDRVAVAPHPRQHLLWSDFHFNHSGGYVGVTWDFDLQFPDDFSRQASFCLLAICILFGELSIQTLPLFMAFLIWSCKSSLNILDTGPFSDVCSAKIFSQSFQECWSTPMTYPFFFSGQCFCSVLTGLSPLHRLRCTWLWIPLTCVYILRNTTLPELWSCLLSLGRPVVCLASPPRASGSNWGHRGGRRGSQGSPSCVLPVVKCLFLIFCPVFCLFVEGSLRSFCIHRGWHTMYPECFLSLC